MHVQVHVLLKCCAIALSICFFGLSPTIFSDLNTFVILPKGVSKQMQWYLSAYQRYPIIYKLLQTWISAITRSVNIHIYMDKDYYHISSLMKLATLFM